MKTHITIDGTAIGNENDCYIIAEIGLNHNNDMSLTKKMIKSAKESGANAVKFQTYITENLTVDNSPAFKIFKDLELDKNQFKEISDYCKTVGITFFSTPFCFKTVDILEELGVPCYKVSSTDLNYYELLKYIGTKGKPIILSTGMSSISEIDKAVNTILNTGNDKIIILHCISKYPPEKKDMNMSMITKLKNLYPNYNIGFSDHTTDMTTSIIARTLGATVIEKHFTLDKNLPGPDHSISSTPEDFKNLYLELQSVDMALQFKSRERADGLVAKGARRSLIAKYDIKKGTILTEDMIAVIRPGTGIAPEFLPIFVGRELKKDILKNQIFELTHI